MSAFIDDNFLLINDYGKKLYHSVAEGLPIIDPHNHLDIASLAGNRKFENIYQLWIQYDPYKHRAMRIYGIPEILITGNRPDYEKFLAWATCFGSTAGNPLFHWSCMELKAVFGIDDILHPSNAQTIWDKANDVLNQGNFTALDIVSRFGVELLCTSDDLTDTLEFHTELANKKAALTCLPSLRADSIFSFTQTSFFTWLEKLQASTSFHVGNLETFEAAITSRLDFFDEAGCLLSDHSLDSRFRYKPCSSSSAAPLFNKVLKSEDLAVEEQTTLQSYLLHFLGTEYAKRKWKMQLHIGAYRNTSSVLRARVGPAGGYACIGSTADVESVCLFLDGLDKVGALPKTILYTLNPGDNTVFASITGSYSEDGVQGKVQFGPAWWYNDHYDGIVQQLLALSSYSLLGTSIGMTTDSRSFLSFVRHDYYRRILCNLLGSWVEEGKLPPDWELVSTMVENISYNNIKTWIKK